MKDDLPERVFRYHCNLSVLEAMLCMVRTSSVKSIRFQPVSVSHFANAYIKAYSSHVALILCTIDITIVILLNCQLLIDICVLVYQQLSKLSIVQVRKDNLWLCYKNKEVMWLLFILLCFIKLAALF